MEPDEPPRVKFLCSFGGSILPRPLDGRLRYVGGETRIVTAPRDVSYSGLLARMQELFDGATSIKYQQPDEDLDALVSVVNDDDVVNMMEEHDKLSAASGDGFTRLRIFLFSPDLDAAAAAALSLSHFDIDDREAERRYVDALNSLVDEQQQQQQQQFPAHPGIDQAQATTLQHHISIPHHGQRYSEIEPPWSPAHFSPGHHVRDFPPSPSTANFHLAGDFSDRDEYTRQSSSRLVMQPYEQQQSSPPLMESMLWPPPGAAAMVQEKGGFPGNLFHAHNVFDGRTCVCEHCRMGFPRSPAPMSDPRYIDPRRNHGQYHMDHQSKIGNEYIGHFSNSCAECYRNREAYMLNQDAKLDPAIYLKEQSEHHHPFYNEAQVPDKGWFPHHHQAGHRLEDPRAHTSGTGRVSEHYAVDGNPINVPFVPGNYYDGQLTPPKYINHDDSRFLQPGTELGSEALHAQHDAGDGSRTHIPGLEDSTLRYGNHPSAYGADNLYKVQQNLPPIHSLRRKAQIPLHPGSSYESSGMTMPNGGISAGFVRSPPQDGSPRLSLIGTENQVQNSWVGQNGGTLQKIIGFDAPASLDYLYDHAPRKVQNIVGQDGRISIITDPSQCQHGMLHVDIPSDAVPLAPTFIDDNMATSITSGYHHFSKMGNEEAPLIRVLEERSPFAETYQTNHGEASMETSMLTSLCLNEKQNANFDANKLKPAESECLIMNVEDPEAKAAKGHTDISVECLDFLPGLIASVRKIALESAEVVKTKAEMDTDENPPPSPGKKDSSLHEVEPENAGADSDGDGEHQKISKIEPTTAEAEALAKGLQTIRNDDLEEIRELGSGTYGAVYHGKWKGSDVAIKRIKASCFAGRPSERERLIADFWKEALILSSLHHPNVVSLYGVVRDGPDGSLATVTEFMVNGSLKQFLQKKDRTIDRRKRLIIAMDAAFGMEYLHGKNIVHFDLKCENLLVNMRDPHRPVCKIGDLGLSKVKQCTLVSGGVRGTLPWMAPELLSGKSNMVTEKIDVYSFGIVMWELLTGEEPYSDVHYASIIGGIVNNTLRPQTPTWCDPEWKSLMEGCWSSDPGKRPSFSEISQKLRKMAAAINVK